jgi:hypothetical protein
MKITVRKEEHSKDRSDADKQKPIGSANQTTARSADKKPRKGEKPWLLAIFH